MERIETSLDMDAPLEAVWATFLDKARWREFSPFEDRSPETPIEAGRSFRFAIRVLGLPPPPLEVTVVACEANARVRWVGGLPDFPWLEGDHDFRFTRLPDGRTRLENVEHFHGALAGTFLGLLGGTYRKAYEAFNRGLAERAATHPGTGGQS